MRAIRTIAHNDVYLFLKDPSGYVWLFAVPLLFVYFFGAGIPSDDSEPTNRKAAVKIENQDTGFMGRMLIEELGEQGLWVILPGEELADEVTRGFRFPADFTEKILAVEPVKIAFFTTEGGNAQADAMLEVRLFRAIIATISRLVELGDNEALGITEENLQRLMAREDAVQLDIRFAGRKVVPAGFNQSLPGIMVMMLLLNMIVFGGVSIAEERRDGVMRRLAVQPMTRGQLILGKIYGRFLLAIAQIAVYAIIAGFVIKIPFTGHGFALLVILAIYGWGCAALGVLIGSVFLDANKVIAAGVLGANVMGALGGCWWPLEIAPEVMQKLGALLPTNWALSALHQIITYGGGWNHIRVELSLLSGFAIIGTILAARWLRYEE